MVMFPRAARVLDEIQRPPQLDRFDVESFLATARAELPEPGATLAELTATLDGCQGLLGELDRFAQKSMRIRLTFSTDDLPPQLRALLQTTVLGYEKDLPLLRSRVAQAMARYDAASAAAVAERVLDAARQVLAVRAALRQGVWQLTAAAASAWLPAAGRAAADRTQPDEQRERWKRACVDLTALAAHGQALEAGTTAERLDRIATPDDPPEEEGPDRFAMLELD